MNRKSAVVTAGVTAALATTIGVTLPALAANGAKTTTQRFDARTSSAPLPLSKTAYVLNDDDVEDGRTIGRDLLACTDAGKGSSHCTLAFAQKGGLLYAEFRLVDSTGALRGAVTGGTGSFTHAEGTLTGQAKSRKDVEITLRYKK